MRFAACLASLTAAAFTLSAGASARAATSPHIPLAESPASTRVHVLDGRIAEVGPAETPTVSPRVVAKVSGPVTTLFGIPVGVPLPGSPLAECSNAELAPRSLCRDFEAERTTLDPARRDGALAALAAAGMRWTVVRIDDSLVDTTALRGMEPRPRPVEMVVDGADAVQYVSFVTPIYARERVLALLTAKYGKPMRTESFGALVAPTTDRPLTAPAYFWEFVNVTIEYHSQSDGWPPRISTDDSPRNGDGAVGRIAVFLPTFEGAAARLASARRMSTPPVKP